MNLPLLYFVWTEEYCQTSPNKNKSPNLWQVTSILVCCIFGEAVHITTTAEDRVTLSWSNGNSSWEPGYYTHKNIRYLRFRIRYNYFNLNAKIASGFFLIWESLIDSKDLYPTKSRFRIFKCRISIFSSFHNQFSSMIK